MFLQFVEDKCELKLTAPYADRQPQGYTISYCGLDLSGQFIVSPKAVSGAATVFVTVKAGGVRVWFHSVPRC